jgi:4-amino-4-deoxy-L-arabinose transferase-like glycosyltransferase
VSRRGIISTLIGALLMLREASVAAMDKTVEVKVNREPRPQRAAPAAHSARLNRDIVLLTALTLLSLFLRVTWAVTRNVVIENEGAEYTRIGVNLAAGNGYVGLMGGPQLVFPPLYPMLIRIGPFFTHSPVASARAVSIAAGTLLVPLIFLIVSAAYERRSAWIAALISGLHPFLIGFSASTYSECLYTTLLAGVVYFALLSLRLPRIQRFIALGSLLGLAYLTKPEIIGQIAVLLVLISVVGAWKHRLTYALSGVAIVLVCCAVLASPYVAYLARYTRHLRLEGKSEVNYVLISRINAGMDPYRAAYGLSDTGQQEGPLLFPQFIGRSTYPHSLKEIVRFFLLAASRNARGLYDGVALYVWLPLLTLCLFGLFRSAWSQERALVELVLLSMFPLACIPVLIAPFLSLRFVLPMMPFVIIWSAKGIDELGDWVQQTVDNLLPVRRPGVYLCIATIVLLSAIILIIGGKNARHVDSFKDADATSMYLKEAGLALAKRANGKVIVDTGTVVAFYSGATWMGMPYASAPVILRYFEQHRPDFIVINRLKQQDGLAEALERDPDARLLPINLRSPLTIYEWKPAPPRIGPPNS